MVTFFVICGTVAAVGVVILLMMYWEAADSLALAQEARDYNAELAEKWRTRYNNLWNCLDDLSLMDADKVPKGLFEADEDDDECPVLGG